MFYCNKRRNILAELNLKQIEDKLNLEFTGDNRKLVSIIDRYTKEDYKIDTHYRKFYYYLDKIEDPHIFEELKDLVENIYTNRYLDVITKEFNNKFSYEEVRGRYKLQRDFYKNFVANTKEMATFSKTYSIGGK